MCVPGCMHALCIVIIMPWLCRPFHPENLSWHESTDVGHLRSCLITGYHGTYISSWLELRLDSRRNDTSGTTWITFWLSIEEIHRNPMYGIVGMRHLEITQNLCKHRHCSIGWSQDLRLCTAPAFHGFCFETTQPPIEHRPVRCWNLYGSTGTPST